MPDCPACRVQMGVETELRSCAYFPARLHSDVICQILLTATPFLRFEKSLPG